MKTKLKIVHVYTSQDSLLYVNGKLVSKWFTVAQADLLKACSLDYETLRGCDVFFRNNSYPESFKEVVLHKP